MIYLKSFYSIVDNWSKTSKFSLIKKPVRLHNLKFILTADKLSLDFWTGYKRINSTHFGNRNHFIALNAFQRHFNTSKFVMTLVPNYILYVCLYGMYDTMVAPEKHVLKSDPPKPMAD